MMAVICQSHLSLGSRVPDYSYHSYTIAKMVPTEADPNIASNKTLPAMVQTKNC